MGYGGGASWTDYPVSAGGGSSGSGGAPAALIPSNACFGLSKYIRFGEANDSMEVMKLQYFLKAYENADTVQINGVYDQATFNAVVAFQSKYAGDVLGPWGAVAPTGYVYITTEHKINEILCGTPNILTANEEAVIAAYRASLTQPVAKQEVGVATPSEVISSGATSTETIVPQLPTGTVSSSSPSLIPIEVGQNTQTQNQGLLANVIATSFNAVAKAVGWVGNTFINSFGWMLQRFGVFSSHK